MSWPTAGLVVFVSAGVLTAADRAVGEGLRDIPLVDRAIVVHTSDRPDPRFPRARIGVRSRPFVLPPGSREGGKTWYSIRLRALVELPKVVDDGVAYVILQTNGVASAQIQFKAVHHHVTVSSVGIIDGTVTRPVLGRRAYVDFRNFVPYGSIRGGRNAVQFAVMEYGGLRLVRAIFLPGTKLHVDSHAPAKATLDIRLAPKRVTVGETTEARFRVTNTGGSSLSYVRISATYSRGLLWARGPTSYRFRGIPSGGTRHGVFRFTALTPGMTQIYLSAQTNSNHPIEAATLVVTKAS